jgi:hypothetical protein
VRLLRWLNNCARLLEVRDPGRSLSDVARRHCDRITGTEEPFSMPYERPDLNDDVSGGLKTVEIGRFENRVPAGAKREFPSGHEGSASTRSLAL